MARKRRTYFQQIAAAVKYESKLNATLIKVTREYGKANFTFKHNKTGKIWRTTLSKLENYNHNNFKTTSNTKRTYWAPKEWETAGKASPHFDGFKVYIIRCTSGKESFYKIGRTFNTVAKRFSAKDFPYTYEVIRECKGTAKAMCSLESHLHNLQHNYKYTPKKEFSGMSECFTKITKETYAYFK